MVDRLFLTRYAARDARQVASISQLRHNGSACSMAVLSPGPFDLVPPRHLGIPTGRNPRARDSGAHWLPGSWNDDHDSDFDPKFVHLLQISSSPGQAARARLWDETSNAS